MCNKCIDNIKDIYNPHGVEQKKNQNAVSKPWVYFQVVFFLKIVK